MECNFIQSYSYSGVFFHFECMRSVKVKQKGSLSHSSLPLIALKVQHRMSTNHDVELNTEDSRSAMTLNS